jgi:hypothetical protein
MQLRIGVVVCSIIAAGAALSGCPTGGNSGVQTTSMQRCTAEAKTEQERSECAWKNADRMAGGR